MNRRAPAALATLVAGVVVACGGGIKSDPGTGTALVCPRTCIDSSTVPPSQLRHSYALVSDGVALQAQAGFSTGSDLRFNVELKNGDGLQLQTPQGAQDFHVPASTLGTLFIDAFATLIAGASPYLSEVSALPGGPTDYRFVYTRNAGAISETVTLPGPFQIASPASGSTVNIALPILTVRVTRSGSYRFTASGSCVDANGNASTGSGLGELGATSAPALDAAGATYSLDLGGPLARLTFETRFARGAIAACDLTLTATAQNDGVPNAAFDAVNSRIFAQQIRSARLLLRPTP
jgi:hypothetical protein